MSNPVQAVVERMTVKNTKAARIEATFSFSLEGNDDLMVFLGHNINNPVHLGISQIQLAFTDTEPPARRPAPEPIQGPQGELIPPHAFEASAEDENKCTVCQLGDSADIHRTIDAHPFSAGYTGATICQVCYRPEDDTVHDVPAEEPADDDTSAPPTDGDDDEGDDDSQRPPANEDEEIEQQEARRRLAGAGRK